MAETLEIVLKDNSPKDYSRPAREAYAPSSVGAAPAVAPSLSSPASQAAQPGPKLFDPASTGFDAYGAAWAQMMREQQRKFEAEQIEAARRVIDPEYDLRRQQEEQLARQREEMTRRREQELEGQRIASALRNVAAEYQERERRERELETLRQQQAEFRRTAGGIGGGTAEGMETRALGEIANRLRQEQEMRELGERKLGDLGLGLDVNRLKAWEQMRQEQERREEQRAVHGFRKEIDPAYRVRQLGQRLSGVPAPGSGGGLGGAVGNLAGAAIGGIGNAATQAAGLDGGGMVADLAKTAANAIPVIGQAIGALIESYQKVAGALDRTAERLAPYSASLSVASAQAQQRQIEGDMRRAQMLEGGLSGFVEARSKLNQESQDLGAKISKVITPAMTALTNVASGLLHGLNNLLSAEFWEKGAKKQELVIIEGMRWFEEKTRGDKEYMRRLDERRNHLLERLTGETSTDNMDKLLEQLLKMEGPADNNRPEVFTPMGGL